MMEPLSQILTHLNAPQRLGARFFIGNKKSKRDVALVVFRKHREEFGSIKSPSYIETKIYQYEKSGKKTKFMDILAKYRVFLSRKLYELDKQKEKLFDLYNLRKETSYPKAIAILKKLVKEHKVANCGEQAEILQHSLLEAGLEARILRFKIWSQNPFEGPIRRKCRDHGFVVIGLDGKENLDNPDKWGKKAFILDPWSGLTGDAKETLPKMLHIFRFDPSKENIAFFHIDPVNVKEYLANKPNLSKKPQT